MPSCTSLGSSKGRVGPFQISQKLLLGVISPCIPPVLSNNDLLPNFSLAERKNIGKYSLAFAEYLKGKLTDLV